MKIVVGMSGGVDSSVAALLLKEQGHDVIGLFMHNWEEQDEQGYCSAEQDFNDVKRVCGRLGIPYYSVNFAREYLDRVFKYFLEEYARGRTPNPDVLCNREIKFGPFLEYALKLGADMIATGHYAGTERGADGEVYLIKAADEDKDQTYFLNQLTKEQLSKVIFPLTDLKKSMVREIAQSNGLITAKKKDSTGICFIGERKFRQFLSEYLPAKPGDILDLEGNLVGRHDGLMYYTKGQRRGLNIGGRKGAEGRWFVVDKDLDSNRLIVSCTETSALYASNLQCIGFNWIPYPPKTSEFYCTVRLRHRQPEQAARVIILNDGKVNMEFERPQRAITEGQYAVIYTGNRCLGGGVIDKVWK